MKKIVFFIFICFIFVSSVDASDRIKVQFYKCVDGDTAYFKIDGNEKKVRFLAVDTPETVHPTKGEESGGKTASDFTCNSLRNAKKLEIQYDEKSQKVDKYNRELVWVFIDDVLFQETLIKEGYAEVSYIYGNYEYVDDLCKIQKVAKDKKLGIWYDGNRKEGYCNNKTTTRKKTTTKTLNVIELVDKGKYQDAFEFLLNDYSFLSAVCLLVILICLKKVKQK